ncbi:CLUMA_CG011078, isoform A [Clunio marinus]|uniref:CLUMA_CG011078, isoform A n=1 Tax=Clunio marinus TaxID=568069 RepID=A0A1J1ID75_9DIPT|nr:CLUMA_CG011078, isoform A [Clunio marinus]
MKKIIEAGKWRCEKIGTEFNLWDSTTDFHLNLCFTSMILLEGNQIWSLAYGHRFISIGLAKRVQVRNE